MSTQSNNELIHFPMKFKFKLLFKHWTNVISISHYFLDHDQTFHTNENIQWNQWLKPFFPCTRNQWLKKVSHLTSFLHLSLDFQFFHVRLPKHNHPGQKLVRIEIQITKCKKNINDVIFPCSQGLMWKIEKKEIILADFYFEQGVSSHYWHEIR